MRKIYAYLTAALVFFLLLHGICGSYVLIGVGTTGAPIFAHICEVLLLAHVLLGLFFTCRTLFGMKKNGGPFYLRQNYLFWLRRLSGVAILVFLWGHFTLFGEMQNGEFIIYEFTTAKFLWHLGLLVAAAVHLLTNIRPLYVALGFSGVAKRTADTHFVCAVLFILMTLMAVRYYFVGL